MTQNSDTKKPRGRPRTGKGFLIAVRLLPDILGAVDRWIEDQPYPKPSRPDALRTMARDWLSQRGYMKGPDR